MKVEVWSDYACPFCYIGQRRLEEALAEFPNKDSVEVVYRSYELDPHAPALVERSLNEMLSTKYGMSVEEAKRMNDGVIEQAKSVGLDFRLDDVKLANTFDAHRLVQFAATKGKDKEMNERLFAAYFTNGEVLSEIGTLIDLAVEVGLDREEVAQTLYDETAFATEVRTDENTAQQIGVRGVPFFVINNKYAISGAQPKETFAGALEKAQGELSLQVIEGNDDLSCTDESCAIPPKVD